MYSLLRKIKTLGEDDPWLDDTAAWIERSRQLQKEKDLAEKRVRALAVGGPLGWSVLRGIWVLHSFLPYPVLFVQLFGSLGWFLATDDEVIGDLFSTGQATRGDGPRIWCEHPSGGGV